MFLSTCIKRSGAILRPSMLFAVNTVLKRSAVCCGIGTKNILCCTPKATMINSIRSFNVTTVKLHEEKAHDHAKLWVIEKATSALLIGIIPCGLLIPNKLFDSILAILITAHSYWGLEAVMVEYIRVILFGPLIPKIAIGFVYVLTVLMLGGLFYLIFNDIGLCRAFWRIWRNMRKPKDSFKRR